MNRPMKNLTIERLQRLADQIPELQRSIRGTPDFQTWHRNTETALINAFGETNRHVDDFKRIPYSPGFAVIGGGPGPDYQRAYVEGLTSAGALLKAAIEEYWEDDVPAAQDSGTPRVDVTLNTREVFIIHGRDYGAKNTVARFLEGLGIQPVILAEKPDEGQTIIEKFERYAQVNFAIALFTPDDVGGLEDDQLRPRTRQNVIFEFGYFIGKYGRDRVRAVVKGDIEIPSDYSGVLYIPFDDSESWKMKLIGEMKSAGFEIDANRAFQ